ncbi:uncharacterized protein CLUP02_06258 [Colletotrichum lupini]|uniref:BTB domain-containing protein n=1 Tax=Colletotrichum lupini TaxID=145971 RepID=A0A9Q8SNY7_9PEZI|nr:uncharacterized protein CLUP02_06258 [Colletotrichum lupini]KAK1714662.1 hypothetical protein BDP67DRAFT_564980 [Colletotrichum lupini]UQC80773.1 hypothetical protein CLUP02_06258 [Colletotrichum lupini]
MVGIDLGSLFNSSKWSDLTIEASGKLFHCHRCVVFSQCAYWQELPLVNGRLVLTGADTTKAILKYLYTGVYTPFNVPCHKNKPERPQANEEGTVDELDYSEHCLFLNACVLIHARTYNMAKLQDQAKIALLAIAPNHTNHADFLDTVNYIINNYQNEEGLQIALQMIMPQYETDAGLRSRVKDLLLIHPRLACALLEHTTEELRLIKREKSLTHFVSKIEPGEDLGVDSPQSTPSRTVRVTPAKRKGDDGEMPEMKRPRESIEE